jgi:DNA mismatch endonuclease, patch repair protein
MALTRSEQMSRIRGRDTSPEMLLRRALFALGLRYRVHYRTPSGRADVTFLSAKVAVEIDGCFWHGCPDHYVRPRGSARFWAAKLAANVRRDAAQMVAMKAAGWRVFRYWEHEVRADSTAVAKDIARRLRSAQAERRPLWRVARVWPLDPLGKMERREIIDILRPGRARMVERARITRKM